MAQGVVATAPSRDEMLLRTWLHGKAHNTASAYRADVSAFLGFAGCAVDAVTLAHLQDWDAALAQSGQSNATRARKLAALKSLLRFAHGLGWIAANPAMLLRVAKARDFAAERIVTQADVMRIIGAETDPRNRAILRLLYVCGLRASEVGGLCWRDMTARPKKGGEARVLGKGGKERTVKVPADLWAELVALTPLMPASAPVVPGHDGGPICRKVVHRAVKRAARRARLNPALSAHWLRHSHASHALDGGCQLHVLQKQLGHSDLKTTSRYAHVRDGDSSSDFIKG